jgi:hypothetical protein
MIAKVFILKSEYDLPEVNFNVDEVPNTPDPGSTSTNKEIYHLWTIAVQITASNGTELRPVGLQAKQSGKQFDVPLLLLGKEYTCSGTFSSERQDQFPE